YLVGRDVGRELDDAGDFAVPVAQGIVGGLDPDLLAALAATLVLRGLIFAAVEACPKVAIAGALALFGRDEHPMMLAPDFIERIADRCEEVRIGIDDGAVEIEFDHRLRPVERLDLGDRVPDLLALEIEHVMFRTDLGAERW